MATNHQKVHQIDEKLPLSKLLPLGLQHVLAMYAGAVIVPIIVGGALNFTPEQMTFLVAADLFTCGIATLIQTLGFGKSIGIKLPVVLGCAFTAVGPMISIGFGPGGITDIYGAIIASGIFVLIASFFFGKLVRFFPPVVTGTVVLIIGLSLITVGINNCGAGAFGAFNGLNPDGTNQYAKDFGDPKYLALAFFTIMFILILNKYTKGFMHALSVLFGLIAGTIVGMFMGLTNFAPVVQASWFHLVTPFYFGAPTFSLGPIITMCLVGLVSMVESTGVFFGLGKVCDKEISEHDIARGIRAEGIAQLLGGIFNAFPYTTFSQNVGLVALTGIRSRYVTVAAGFILVGLGLLPKFAALATIIPNPVLGGAMIALFGMVAASGIKMLQQVDFSKTANMLIVACSVSMGVGAAVVTPLFGKMPEMFGILFGSGIVSGSVTALLLNLFFNFKEIMSKSEEDVFEEVSNVDDVIC
jgi:xanthine permease